MVAVRRCPNGNVVCRLPTLWALVSDSFTQVPFHFDVMTFHEFVEDVSAVFTVEIIESLCHNNL